MEDFDFDCVREGFSRWIGDRMEARVVNGPNLEITVPFLDRHNDYLQFYIKIQNTENGFCLTDGGHVLLDLERSGCPIDNPENKAVIEEVMNGLGTRVNGREIEIKCETDDLPLAMTSLIQAMIAGGNLFYPLVALSAPKQQKSKQQ